MKGLISDGMHYDRSWAIKRMQTQTRRKFTLDNFSIDNSAEINMFIFEFLMQGVVSNQ
jgi:hypothetical protein